MKQSLSTRVVRALWYDRPSALAVLLQPFAWLYRLGALMHRAAYRKGLLKVRRAPVPVIVVGNLVAGGGGKTPFTIWLAQRLVASGLRPGIASRGYGRKGREAQLVTDDSLADDVGDEPLLLAKNSGLPVAVAARRADACELLCSEAAIDVVICDDGLQHWALARDVEICVVSGPRGFGNERLLPAGPLREPKDRLRDFDFVVVQGDGFESPGAYRARRRLNAPTALGSAEKRPWPLWKQRSVAAVAGIADPNAFFQGLKALGLNVTGYPLDDHAPIDENWLLNLGMPVLLTEKDAARLRSDVIEDIWVVPLEIELENGDTFIQDVLERVRKASV